MKLSIIIPHYNTFELITNLLINLSNQDREDIEVIIIDDSKEERLDKFIDLGTHQEISKRQNIKLKTLQFYGTNVYKKRIKGKEENSYILIKIEKGEEDGEGN